MFPAEKKFWSTPELIERLLLNLDLKSTMCLAQAHELTQNVLEGTRVWNKLIKRICPIDTLDQVENHVAIVKSLKDYEDHLLDLLEVICESNPVPDGGDWHIAVQMGCPCHPNLDYHVVSLAGFMLLEEVEGAFGTTVQTLEVIGSDWRKHPFNSTSLSALASRLSRQQEKLTFLKLDFKISSMLDAENFKAVMQACPMERVSIIGGLEVDENIGAKGWELVAESVQLHPGVLTHFVTCKEAMDGGWKEDMRAIWDALIPSGSWTMIHYDEPGEPSDEPICKEDGDAGWEDLEHVVDMSIEEWRAEKEEWLQWLRDMQAEVERDHR